MNAIKCPHCAAQDASTFEVSCAGCKARHNAGLADEYVKAEQREASGECVELATKAMAQHTPGPWVIRNDREVFRGNRRVCSVNAAESLSLGAEMERAKANACLIAAAPELLAALIALASEYDAASRSDNGQGWDAGAQPQMIAAYDAIAKATGSAA